MREKVCVGLASGLLATAIVLAFVLFGTAAMVGDRSPGDEPLTAKDGIDPAGVRPVGASAVIESGYGFRATDEDTPSSDDR